MPVGTPLYAARAGKIANVAYAQLGLTALGTNQTDWYIHIDRAVTAVGHNVAKGELIAYSGNKGPSCAATTGPHLHFEVQTAAPPWYNRPATSVDPVPVLAPTFTFGSGSPGDTDLTPEQDGILRRVFNLLMVGYHTNTPADDGYLKKNVKPELDQILNEPAGAVTIDNTAVLNAITALKAELDVASADLATIKRLVMKDLAP